MELVDPSDLRLRTRPRQARSEQRIEALLAAGDQVIVDRGFDAATTNHIAAAAEVSPATLYRWYPDKYALAGALLDRYQGEFEDVLGRFVVDDLSLRSARLVDQAVGALSDYFAQHPAALELVHEQRRPGRRSPLGTSFGDLLARNVQIIVLARVPDAPSDEATITAEAIVDIALSGIATAHHHRGKRRGERIAETCYAIAAYLSTKYPFEDSVRHDALLPHARIAQR